MIFVNEGESAACVCHDEITLVDGEWVHRDGNSRCPGDDGWAEPMPPPAHTHKYEQDGFVRRQCRCGAVIEVV